MLYPGETEVSCNIISFNTLSVEVMHLLDNVMFVHIEARMPLVVIPMEHCAVHGRPGRCETRLWKCEVLDQHTSQCHMAFLLASLGVRSTSEGSTATYTTLWNNSIDYADQ